VVALLALIGCANVDDTPADPICTNCEEVGPSPRFSRLTHAQWENAVRDLLRLDAQPGLSEGFIGDILSDGGFDNDADTMVVSPELWSDYQRAAEALATQVVTDPDAYGRIVPEDPLGSTVAGDPTRIEAEGPDASATAGGEVGDAWMVWSNGELAADFDVSDPGSYALVARVWQNAAGSEDTEAEIRLNGVPLQTFDVTATTEGSAQEISVLADLDAGPQTVSVAFLNDFVDPNTGADRNLLVDWVEIRPQAEGLPATPEDRDAWIRRFGRRVHRRPLTDAQVAQYADVFETGAGLEFTGAPFKDGVYTALLAFLQSPYFLYRVELSETLDEDGRIALDDYELATKLSLALWNTIPDDALLDAAENGEVLADPTGLATRMLDDERAHTTIDHFHYQLLNLDAYKNIFKDTDLFPFWSPALNAAMQDEALTYSRSAFYDGDSIFGFYTSPHTYVNSDLAPIYGLSSSSDTLERVELDPTQRAGILTTSGFLAYNAHARELDSIHRGVFVNLRLICSDLPPPPPVIPPLPPPEPGLTNRQRVDAHTGDGTCGAGCHSNLINPVGFAFENFDAIGQWRDTDAGQPVDATGAFAFEDGDQTWDGPVGFAAAMGNSYDAHSCLIRNWMRFTHGREPSEQDENVIARLARQSTAGDTPIRQLVLDLVTAESFRYRQPLADSNEGGAE
jgi:hypothetical protein